jgi:hypothetical protein
MSIEMPYPTTHHDRPDTAERRLILCIAIVSAVGCVLTGIGLYRSSESLTNAAGVLAFALFGAIALAVTVTGVVGAWRAFSSRVVIDTIDPSGVLVETNEGTGDQVGDVPGATDSQPVPGHWVDLSPTPLGGAGLLIRLLESEAFAAYRRRLAPRLSEDAQSLLLRAPRTADELQDCRGYDRHLAGLLHDRAIAKRLFIDAGLLQEGDQQAVESVVRTILQLREARHADQECYIVAPPHPVREVMQRLTEDESWELSRTEFDSCFAQLFGAQVKPQLAAS